MSRVACVIPARHASTRFPGKPLAKILGKPMLQWVWEGASQSKHADQVLVATDDKRILGAATAFGATCVMTESHHLSGTDRIAEVALIHEAEIFINVQGDEPLITGDIIDAVIAPLLDNAGVKMVSAYRIAGADDDMLDPNIVKVVCDRKSDALYFSRYPIPYDRDTRRGIKRNIHVGIYAYRRDFLLELSKFRPTPLEESERLEQLRVLEHGHKIRMVQVDFKSVGVDRPADIGRAEAALRALDRA